MRICGKINNYLRAFQYFELFFLFFCLIYSVLNIIRVCSSTIQWLIADYRFLLLLLSALAKKLSLYTEAKNVMQKRSFFSLAHSLLREEGRNALRFCLEMGSGVEEGELLRKKGERASLGTWDGSGAKKLGPGLGLIKYSLLLSEESGALSITCFIQCIQDKCGS